jgi:hypothetical protein
VILGDPERDAEKPSLDAAASLEVGEATLDHDEDVLNGVFELRCPNPQPP